MKFSSDSTCDHEDNNNGMKKIDIHHMIVNNIVFSDTEVLCIMGGYHWYSYIASAIQHQPLLPQCPLNSYNY